MARKHGFFRPHVAGLSGIYSTTLREGGGDPILAAFADGTDGFYFDFSKTDRLFRGSTTSLALALADDAGENIGVAHDSHGWAGGTLATQIASAPDTVTNGDNEAALFSSSLGAISIGYGTLAQSADQANGGTKSAKYLCNTATSDGHSVSLVVPAGASVAVSADFYVPTGSIQTARIYDGNDGSWFGANSSTVKDGWVTLTAFRPAKGSDWALAFGDNVPVSIDGQAFYNDNIRIALIPGNHGLQATTAAQPKWQTGGLARFDGSDDNLLTTLVPGTAMSLIAKTAVPATLSAVRVLIGGTIGTQRCFFGIDTSGRLCAGVGTQGTTTIVGANDLRSSTVNVSLVFNGTTVKLYEGASEVYSAAQAGAPGSNPLRLGATNEGGVDGNHYTSDIYHALAIKKALSAAEIAAITNLWGTS